MLEKKGTPMEENQKSDQPEANEPQEVTAELPPPVKERLLKRTALWFLAVILAASAMIYQRATGPTYPMKVPVAGNIIAKLIRTHESTGDATVELPIPEAEAKTATATLYYKRYRTDDDFTPVTMETVTSESGTQFEGALPKQPAAGKLQYYIEAEIAGQARAGGSICIDSLQRSRS